MPGSPAWLEALHRPAAYPHAVAAISLLETHLSWVFLTGEWAYKLKKPIQLPFVDFSSLEKRKAACEEELRLNRRTVPAIYEGLVTLRRSDEGPRITDAGPVLEYAVKMRQFPQSDLLLAIADSGRLTGSYIEHLAGSIAAMHRVAAVAPHESAFGLPATVRRYTEGCLPPIAAALAQDEQGGLEAISRWVNDEADRLEGHFGNRRSAGFVRECHGDLHLGNIVLVDGIPQPFDCLEFNPDLRFIDVISDVAFIFMDLIDHQSPEFAWQLLNGWLDQTGDFAGLAALRYYAVYRALVRAKVAAIRLAQPGLTDVDRTTSRSQLGGYVSLANRLSSRGPSGIILMHGLSGSGKSSVGRRLSCDLGAVCLRSDIERKRSAGSDGAPSGQTDYSDAAIGETYQRLLSTTEMLLGHGLPVVVDATFLNQAYRRQFEELADRTGVQWAIVACDAPDAVLEERVKRRQAQGNDASDATVDVLRSQRKLIQPLTAHESAHTIRCDTSTAVDGKTLKESVAARLARS